MWKTKLIVRSFNVRDNWWVVSKGKNEELENMRWIKKWTKDKNKEGEIKRRQGI